MARPYSSELRSAQSRATWERIAAAARELMIERGYASTSMADVAARAGVALPTLYAAVRGGKPALARLTYDITLMGDADPVPMAGRADVQRLIDSPDARVKLTGYARLNAEVWSRLGPVLTVLRDAAASEGPDSALAATLREAERRRRQGAKDCAQSVAEAGGVREGLPISRAADQLFALASLETFTDLTDVCGWTVDEYADWLGRQMVSAVMGATGLADG